MNTIEKIVIFVIVTIAILVTILQQNNIEGLKKSIVQINDEIRSRDAPHLHIVQINDEIRSRDAPHLHIESGNDEPLPEPKTPDNDEPLNDKQQRALRDIENKAYFKGWNNGYERRSEERRDDETEKNCDICGKVEGHRCLPVASRLISHQGFLVRIYSLNEFYPTDMPWAFFIKKDSVVYRSARFATRHAAEAESKRVIDKHFAE